MKRRTQRPKHFAKAAATLLAPRSVVLLLTILLWLVAVFADHPGAVSAARKLTKAPARFDGGLASTATREGRLAVFDDLWQTVADRYYSETFHGVDWQAQRSIFRPLAADAAGSRELYQELRRLLRLLQDAHTRVYAPEEKFDWQHPRFISVGISIREVEGQPTVFMVDHGSQAERASIHPGDVIETIGGQSATALLEQRQRELRSSTSRASQLQALGSLTDGLPETTVEIEWRDARSREHAASFRRQWHERSFALRTYHPAKGIVAIELDAFTQALAFELAEVVREKFHDVRGIILDLRSNGGGDTNAMALIASVFLPPATGLGQFMDRHGNVVLTLETDAMIASRFQRAEIAQTPLVILTSERTSSAAEIFVAALQRRAQVAVLGSQTCGCVLAIRTQHELPDGGRLDISELDYRTEKGERLEGQGITPAETSNVTRADLYAHRDRLVKAALTKLRSFPAR
jgi:carboxyl-terminal processing protease